MTAVENPMQRLNNYQTGDPNRGYKFLYLAIVTNGKLVEELVADKMTSHNIDGYEWYDSQKLYTKKRHDIKSLNYLLKKKQYL